MSYWLRYFLDPRGRLNRAKFLLYYLFQFLAACIANVAMRGFDLLNGDNFSFDDPSTPLTVALIVLLLPVSLLLLVGSVVIPIKRLHDRNRSGVWWVTYLAIPLVFFLLMPTFNQSPYVGAIFGVFIAAGVVFGLWLFLEMVVFAGTPGDNRFGPDPLANRGAPVS